MHVIYFGKSKEQKHAQNTDETCVLHGMQCAV